MHHSDEKGKGTVEVVGRLRNYFSLFFVFIFCHYFLNTKQVEPTRGYGTQINEQILTVTCISDLTAH